MLLAVLQRSPMHGYQLLQELERRFAPQWRPSPGSIYPALDALVAEGLLASVDDDGRSVLKLTASGTAALERRVEQLAEVEARTGIRLRPHDAVQSAWERLHRSVRAAEPHMPVEEIVAILQRADDELHLLANQKG